MAGSAGPIAQLHRSGTLVEVVRWQLSRRLGSAQRVSRASISGSSKTCATSSAERGPRAGSARYQ